MVAGAAALLLVGANACKATKDAKDNITSASDFSSAETEFSGAFDVTDDINQSDGKIKKGGSTILPGGAVFTWVDSVMDSDGIKYIIDFGALGTAAPKGMLCNDGKYRAGKLHVSVSKHYADIGCTAAVSADAADLYFSGDGTNMFGIEGTISVSRTAAEELQVITDGKITNPDLKTAKFHGTKNIKRTAGASTPGLLGDVYEVTGNGGGTNIDGQDYTWNITKALVKKIEVGCAKTFIQGVLTIQNTSANNNIEIDFDPYNNQACDRVAQADINGKKIIFTVK